MPTVILIGLLLLGLVAGFYVSHKARALARQGSNTPTQLLYRQARRQFRGWLSGLKKRVDGSDEQN